MLFLVQRAHLHHQVSFSPRKGRKGTPQANKNQCMAALVDLNRFVFKISNTLHVCLAWHVYGCPCGVLPLTARASVTCMLAE